MKYIGQIMLMSEQGCGAWPQFHDNRGLHGDEKQYWSWAWTINFNQNTKIKNLKIWNKKNKLLYNDSWTFGSSHRVTYIVCPKEIKPEKWLVMLSNEPKKCEIETDLVLPDLKLADTN